MFYVHVVVTLTLQLVVQVVAMARHDGTGWAIDVLVVLTLALAAHAGLVFAPREERHDR